MTSGRGRRFEKVAAGAAGGGGTVAADEASPILTGDDCRAVVVAEAIVPREFAVATLGVWTDLDAAVPGAVGIAGARAMSKGCTLAIPALLQQTGISGGAIAVAGTGTELFEQAVADVGTRAITAGKSLRALCILQTGGATQRASAAALRVEHTTLSVTKRCGGRDDDHSAALVAKRTRLASGTVDGTEGAAVDGVGQTKIATGAAIIRLHPTGAGEAVGPALVESALLVRAAHFAKGAEIVAATDFAAAVTKGLAKRAHASLAEETVSFVATPWDALGGELVADAAKTTLAVQAATAGINAAALNSKALRLGGVAKQAGATLGVAAASKLGLAVGQGVAEFTWIAAALVDAIATATVEVAP